MAALFSYFQTESCNKLNERFQDFAGDSIPETPEYKREETELKRKAFELACKLSNSYNVAQKEW